MKLYEVAENLKGLQAMIDDGVPMDQLEDTIGAIEMDFKEKAESILYVIRNLEGDIETIKSEEDRLKQIRQQRENRKKGIIDYLKRNMSAGEITKVDNGVISATLIKPKKMASIGDESLIPMTYKKIKTSSSIDKKKLLNDLKAGNEIEGATLTDSDFGLTIK